MQFLAHMAQRVLWGIVIIWRPSSFTSLSDSFYILMFLSEAAGTNWNQAW
jgi:hypothetical protein